MVTRMAGKDEMHLTAAVGPLGKKENTDTDSETWISLTTWWTTAGTNEWKNYISSARLHATACYGH
jgi:hypothetical protein